MRRRRQHRRKTPRRRRGGEEEEEEGIPKRKKIRQRGRQSEDEDEEEKGEEGESVREERGQENARPVAWRESRRSCTERESEGERASERRRKDANLTHLEEGVQATGQLGVTASVPTPLWQSPPKRQEAWTRKQ